MQGHYVSIILHIVAIFGIMWIAPRLTRCYSNEDKCVFWKAEIKFVLVVMWNCAAILWRFTITCDYSFQWNFLYGGPKITDFAHSIHPLWTNFLASIGNAEVSLLSFWRCRLLEILHSLCTFLITWRIAMVTVAMVAKRSVFCDSGSSSLYLHSIASLRISGTVYLSIWDFLNDGRWPPDSAIFDIFQFVTYRSDCGFAPLNSAVLNTCVRCRVPDILHNLRTFGGSRDALLW